MIGYVANIEELTEKTPTSGVFFILGPSCNWF